jgi:hypothetical protein
MRLVRTVVVLCAALVGSACIQPVAEVEDGGAVACGAGTVLEGGLCVSVLSCGAGTHREGAVCFPNTATLTCGAGTVEQAGVCVAQLSCGQGTTQQGMSCVATGQVTCGPGTTQQGSQCVASSGLTCGSGTMQVGTECVPAGTSTTVCGAGTMLVGNECLPVNGTPVTCGAGTVRQGNTCVVLSGADGGWYEVRIGALQVPADGFSKVPVFAIGRLANGSPALDSIVLSVSRAGAGTLVNSGLQLQQLGAGTYFTPCSSANNPLCVGPAQIELRLASAPTVVVANSQEFTLVAPPGVGTTAPCDPYPNALFFDGSGYIFTGTQLVTLGMFSASNSTATHVTINVDPSMSTQGLWWYCDFAAPSGAGPLAEQVYSMASRYPFQPPGVAGLSVTGDGRGCNQSSGRFQVHHLVNDPMTGQLSEFTATFEQFCENSQTNVLRGCVKFTR